MSSRKKFILGDDRIVYNFQGEREICVALDNAVLGRSGQITLLRLQRQSYEKDFLLLSRRPHECLARFYALELFRDHQLLYMEYSGLSLRERYAQEPRLDNEQEISIVRDLASGLQHLHSHGLLNRALSSETVQLTQWPNPMRAKIADFFWTHDMRTASVQMWPGEHKYAPPEIYTHLGLPADVFALGCVALEMCLYRQLPEIDHIGKVRTYQALVPSDHPIRNQIAMCLASMPHARPTASLLLDLLHPDQENVSIPPLLVRASGRLIQFGSDRIHVTPGDQEVEIAPPSVKSVSRSYTQTNGDRFRIEKVVNAPSKTGACGGGVGQVEFSVALKIQEMASNDQAFLVSLEDEESPEWNWTSEHTSNYDKDANEVDYLMQPPESLGRPPTEPWCSITNESNRSSRFHGRRLVESDCRSPYSEFGADRARSEVRYKRPSFGKDVLIVSSSETEAVAEFIRQRASSIACRYLVYAQRGVGESTDVCVKAATCCMYDTPKERVAKVGWRQIGATDEWIILDAKPHWIRCRLDLGAAGERRWKKTWEPQNIPATKRDIRLRLQPWSEKDVPGEIHGRVFLKATTVPEKTGTFTVLGQDEEVSGSIHYDSACHVSLMVDPKVGASTRAAVSSGGEVEIISSMTVASASCTGGTPPLSQLLDVSLWLGGRRDRAAATSAGSIRASVATTATAAEEDVDEDESSLPQLVLAPGLEDGNVTLPPQGLQFKIGSDTVTYPPGNSHIVQWPVIQDFSFTVPDPQGDVYCLEKAVTMRPSGLLFSEPIRVNLKMDPISQAKFVYLVHTDNETCPSGLWKTEHSGDSDSGDASDTFIVQPPEEQPQETMFSITDEDGTCVHYPEEQTGVLRNPYHRTVVDRANGCVTYWKQCHCKEILVVTTTQDKDRIRSFIRTVLGRYHACRYLVYGRPHHLDGVQLAIDLRSSGVFKAPVTRKPKDGGWKQLGPTDGWFLLSLRRHHISGRLTLDPLLKEQWDHTFEAREVRASAGLRVILTPKPGTSPRKVIGHFDVYTVAAGETHKITAPVRYDVVKHQSLLPADDCVAGVHSADPKMSENHQIVLTKARPLLMQSLQLDDTLLDFLLSETLISHAIHSDLKKETDRTAQNHSFLNLLRSLGPRAFPLFLTGLERTRIDVNLLLADYLRSQA